MIKNRLRMKDGEIWVFGLSTTDLGFLQKGQGLAFNLSTMGLPPQRVLIVHGATDDIIETKIQEAVAGLRKIPAWTEPGAEIDPVKSPREGHDLQD
jgi:hypothetical protein